MIEPPMSATFKDGESLNDSRQSPTKYSYYDSSVVKNSGPGGLIPHKSSLKTIKLAEDEHNTKMTEDVYLDMDHNSRLSLNKYFDNRPSKAYLHAPSVQDSYGSIGNGLHP